MNIVQVEQALGMFRTYLAECAAEQDWSEHRWSELAEVVRECFRRAANAPTYAPPLNEQRLTRDMLRRVVRFVNDNIDSKLTWDDIADEIGMDRYAFGRRFKLTTGITPHQYVIRCRIRKAMKLLAHGRLGLADIALEVGCSCQSHFTTLFRDHVGTTPGEFRRRVADRGSMTYPPRSAALVPAAAPRHLAGSFS
jgi:transcriptional regulator GlxA family with amidase domain